MAQFNTDLEGPITLDDNAFELASAFLPEGARAFALLSRYDDILAEVVERPGYRAGSTLKLILPFLLAFGLDQEAMEDLSKDIRFVPDAVEAIEEIQRLMPVFIISTSYEPYVRAVGDLLGLPRGNAYSTEVDLGRYSLSRSEEERLKELYSEILSLPMIEVPAEPGAGLPLQPRRVIAQLDRIFREIAAMEIGRVLREVEPRGGEGKAAAVLDSLERTGGGLDGVIYVGDSITDVAALELVREGGGLAVAFNGNRYAIRAAEVACLSRSARPLQRIAEVFRDGGKGGVLELAREGELAEEGVTAVGAADEPEALIARSERLREEIRGEAGALG